MVVGYRCRFGRNEFGGECVSYVAVLFLKKRELEWIERREFEKLVVGGGRGLFEMLCFVGVGSFS